MNASEDSPREGQECSGPPNSRQPDLTWYRCRFCGNVVAREERPTRCYVCRRGENEPPETRLYAALSTPTERVMSDGGAMPRVSVRFSEETVERIEEVRWARSEPDNIVSRSEVLREAVQWYLEEYVDGDRGPEGEGEDGDRVDEGDTDDTGDEVGGGVTKVGEASREELGHEEAHEYVDRVRELRRDGE